MPRKAISAVVATVLLLMMTVSAAGIAYVWTGGIQSGVQETGTEQTQAMQEAASSCMSVDGVSGRTVYLRNCGSGTISGNTLLIYIDGLPANGTLATSINPNNVGNLVLSGIWQLNYGKHKIRITNGVTEVTQNVVAEVNKEDLVGYWSFDEGQGGIAYDGSRNGNDGTITNISSDVYGDGSPVNGLTFAPPIWASGKFSSSLSFNGQSSYVSTTKAVDDAIQPNGQVTLAAWIRPISYANPVSSVPGRLIVGETGTSFQTRYAIYIDSSGKLKYGWGNGVYISGNKIMPLNEWQFVAASQSGTNIKLFVDGNLDLDYTGLTSILDITADQEPVAIGMWTDWWERSSTVFNGAIDEARIYNKALSPDEMINLKPV